ncbi:YpeB-like protein with putative protease inhibitory function [Modicisalibacter xianhensis]|uniref:YpeB-like protein with putative protease inhibitory function n=1 Tax=Modicisalibacter xianhensis TaxID=442341 RepID=A0A4R8FWU1_9GAMM|nr:PepSY domain-containing protein [Halomonas xianhensis]TDX31067.1 YpeB-like protein with putative protease inhibitory function [Halomonas xianhensis]
MKTRLFMPAVLLTLSLISMGQALAEDRCQVPKDQWQPQSALEAKLVEQGWTIKRIKEDDGCYEVYATDAEGKRREVYFDPKTLEPVGEDE